MVCGEGALAGLALLLIWLCDLPLCGTILWSIADAAIGALLSIPMIVGMLIFLRLPTRSSAEMRRFCDAILRPIFHVCRWPELLLISLVAGVTEELLFRGALQTIATSWWGPTLALLASSVLFGLLHPFSIVYVVFAALMGAYLGALWLVFGNLLVPMLAHGAYDFVMLLMVVKDPVRWLGAHESR